MLYHVSRGGQVYGPYTLEDLRRYVASGNVLLSDLAKSEEMADWISVAQILGVAEAPATAISYPPAGAVYAPNAVAYPDPPNLHWALVLLIGIFTCGLFIVVWEFVQAVWMRRVNPRSNAVFFYIGYVIVSYGGTFGRFLLMASSGFHNQFIGLTIPMWLLSWVLAELAFFDMRRSLEEHFNGPEPIGLTLNPVMTFFFGPFYFQYHLSRINELKRLARYRGASI